MANTLQSRTFHDASNGSARVTKTARPVGRPPQNGHAAQRVRLAPATLRAWLATVERALAAPRAASTADALRGLATDLAVRLRPYADAPATPPEAGMGATQRPAWRVTRADGTDVVVDSLLAAAREYGAKPASLRTMLSRGGGACRKTAWHAGNESEVRCERLA